MFNEKTLQEKTLRTKKVMLEKRLVWLNKVKKEVKILTMSIENNRKNEISSIHLENRRKNLIKIALDKINKIHQ